MRAPCRGLRPLNSSRKAMRPGISVSPMRISRRPQPANSISATMKSPDLLFTTAFMSIDSAYVCERRFMVIPTPEDW